jgi:hypothetical protein
MLLPGLARRRLGQLGSEKQFGIVLQTPKLQTVAWCGRDGVVPDTNDDLRL